MVIENVNILSLLLNSSSPPLMFQKACSAEFRRIGMEGINKPLFSHNTTVIDGQEKGTVGEKVSIGHQLAVFFASRCYKLCRATRSLIRFSTVELDEERIGIKGRFSQPESLDHHSVFARRLGGLFSNRCILFRSIASSIS
jgi:hypothetical protein